MVKPLEKFRTPAVDAKYPPMKAGEHLMRMTVTGFRYLNDMHNRGLLPLDYEVPEENPFKRRAAAPS